MKFINEILDAIALLIYSIITLPVFIISFPFLLYYWADDRVGQIIEDMKYKHNESMQIRKKEKILKELMELENAGK